MYNLQRLYNQNRKKIWLIIAIIVFALILLRSINNMVAEQKREKSKNEVTNKIEDVTSSMSENYTVISDQKIENTVQTENTEIIDAFLQACNRQKVEDAYNMLSDECKELKYPRLEVFVNNYYNTIFTTQKSFNKEAWMQKKDVYTYRITIIDDPLATGTVNYGNSFQDFYTIVKSDNGQKLNISSFVVREYLEKSQQVDNVTVNVKYRDCYMNYEEYVIEVNNLTDNTIVLDSKEKTDTTYLIGENDNKFSSYNSEMSIQYKENIEENNSESVKQENTISNNIIISARTNKKIKIKFNKMYNPERKIKKMEFSDVIMNYKEYLQSENKSNYSKTKITINL